MVFKWFLIPFMVLHGAMHLIGWVVNLDRARVGSLTGKLSFGFSKKWRKPLAQFWLLALILFIAGSMALLLNYYWWWWEILAAVIISQSLIVVWWQDAKTGTILNLLILIALMLL